MASPVIVDSKDIFAVLIKPREPFLNWARNIPPLFPDLTLEELCEDPNIYLFSDCHSHDECLECINKCYKIIFENELNNWNEDKALWPGSITESTFEEWFSLEIFSSVNRICCLNSSS